MAAWLIPALKAVLPHVGTIVSAAAPVFTKKTADAANQAALRQQQITELQDAVSQNAENIKDLAEQLSKTVAALEDAASIAEAKLRRSRLLCVWAVIVSLVSLAAVLVLIFTR